MNRIAIAGRQARFPALVRLCQVTGTRVALWDPDGLAPPSGSMPEGVESVELDALIETPLVLFCVGAERAREAARALGDVIGGRHVVVHTSRDLEPETSAPLSKVLREETATHRVGFLTGPMRGVDIEQGLSSSCTVYSHFPEVHEFLEEALVSERFRLYRSEDLEGAEITAAYARIIAIIWGIGLGMEQGGSVGATLFARGLAEIGRLIAGRGGQERTVFGMSGAGNLFADVQAPHSVEVEVGRAMVAQGGFEAEAMRERFGPVIDRLRELVGAMHDHSQSAGLRAGICQTAHQLFTGELDVAGAAHHLMTLPVLDE